MLQSMGSHGRAAEQQKQNLIPPALLIPQTCPQPSSEMTTVSTLGRQNSNHPQDRTFSAQAGFSEQGP